MKLRGLVYLALPLGINGFVARTCISTRSVSSTIDDLIDAPSIAPLREEPIAPFQSVFLSKQANSKGLHLSSKNLADDSNSTAKYWDATRISAVITYVALLAFIFVSPGAIGDPADNELIAKIVADPSNPGINPYFYTIFNLFTTMPIILAAVTCPQASREGLPPAPFLLASAAIGYFIYGPYLIFRKQPLDTVSRSDLGWVTRNILDSRAMGVFTLVLTILALLAPDAIGAYQADPAGTWQEFVALMTSSKLCAVSAFDLTILFGFIINLTAKDYQLRKPDATAEEALKIAALTGLWPYVGSAIYMVLRPSLPDEA